MKQKNKFGKSLALFMALVMVLSLMPASSAGYAADQITGGGQAIDGADQSGTPTDGTGGESDGEGGDGQALPSGEGDSDAGDGDEQGSASGEDDENSGDGQTLPSGEDDDDTGDGLILNPGEGDDDTGGGLILSPGEGDDEDDGGQAFVINSDVCTCRHVCSEAYYDVDCLACSSHWSQCILLAIQPFAQSDNSILVGGATGSSASAINNKEFTDFGQFWNMLYAEHQDYGDNITATVSGIVGTTTPLPTGVPQLNYSVTLTGDGTINLGDNYITMAYNPNKKITISGPSIISSSNTATIHINGKCESIG